MIKKFESLCGPTEEYHVFRPVREDPESLCKGKISKRCAP